MKQNAIFCLLIALSVAAPSAQAGTKEEIMRLQSDVLGLQNQIREFEKSFNERTDGLKSLIVQLNDQVAKSNLVLDRISSILENQSSGVQSTDKALLQEMRALTQKIDDNSTAISAVAQQLNELKVQSKSLAQPETPGGGLSQEAMFKQAFDDFVEGRLDLAIKEFQDYLNVYPGGNQAAAALLNIGEAYSYQAKLPQAIAAYTRVINDYPDSDKVVIALFKRAKAELGMKESDSAISDFKNIIEKYPTAPEAELSKAELRNLGVSLTKPAKKTRR